MNKYRGISLFLTAVFMCTAAYGQQNPQNHQTKTVAGAVTSVDFVGNTISILTDGQHRMSFFVPGNSIITRDTHDIGLMDIKEGHPVTIQYDIMSPGKNTADSIIDNQPSSHES